MAKKITDLEALTTPDPTDILEIVDISTNSNKKTTVDGIHKAMPSKTVTPDKLDLPAVEAIVVTGQTTTSTTFTDLATPGPSVTVTIGANGLALVSTYAWITNNTAGQYSIMGFTMSGANTAAAQDGRSLVHRTYVVNGFMSMGMTILLTGLNPGPTTFTCVYRVGGNTGTFENRRIAVVPL